MISVAAEEASAARAYAIRALLARPLLDRGSAAFTAVVAHTAWLQRWFDDKCGWVLVVDARHGFARLRKIPACPGVTRHPRTARSTPQPFTRRRYSLFAIIAAVLSDLSRPQISLRDIVERVQAVTAETAGVAEFTPRRDERIALVDAIALLADLGVLSIVESRGDYVSDREANALYDIDDRRLGHLITAPVPPSLATTLQHLLYEARYGPWVPPNQGIQAGDDTNIASGIQSLDRARVLAAAGAPAAGEDQLRRHARHRIMRILLDDPILYIDRLDAHERGYMQQTIGGIANWVAEAGMILERRAEGWAAIDPDGNATDIRFPEGNDLVKFAALLLLSALQPSGVPDRPVRHPRQGAEMVISERLRLNPTWARGYQTEDGPALLTAAALNLLAAFDLAVIDGTGFTLLPAAGRYRPKIADISRAFTSNAVEAAPALEEQR